MAGGGVGVVGGGRGVAWICTGFALVCMYNIIKRIYTYTRPIPWPSPHVLQHVVALRYLMRHVVLLFTDFECDFDSNFDCESDAYFGNLQFVSTCQTHFELSLGKLEASSNTFDAMPRPF